MVAWYWIPVSLLAGALGYFIYDNLGSIVSRIHKAEAKLAALKTKAVAEARKVV